MEFAESKCEKVMRAATASDVITASPSLSAPRPMSIPTFWSSPLKYLRYQTYTKPQIVLAFALGIGGPAAALFLYPARERLLYPDATLIPMSYPLPAQRNPNLKGYDD